VAANFLTDLKRGQQAEVEFLHIYPLVIKPSKVRAWDFEIPDGPRLELKADFYNVTKTENLFMERWSCFEQKSPGGIWQSRDNGADWFIYWFPSGRFWMEFRDLEAAIERIDRMQLPEIVVTNERQTSDGQTSVYSTVGYKIRRGDLYEVCDIYTY